MVMHPDGIRFFKKFGFIFDRFSQARYWFGVLYTTRALGIALLPVLCVNEHGPTGGQLLDMVFGLSKIHCLVNLTPQAGWLDESPVKKMVNFESLCKTACLRLDVWTFRRLDV